MRIAARKTRDAEGLKGAGGRPLKTFILEQELFPAVNSGQEGLS